MMSDMAFTVPLAKFLKARGEIYTVRKFRYSTRECYIEGVGCCDRRLIRRITAPIELEPYVDLSGFSSLRDWEGKIHNFIKPTDDRFLYKVVIKK